MILYIITSIWMGEDDIVVNTWAPELAVVSNWQEWNSAVSWLGSLEVSSREDSYPIRINLHWAPKSTQNAYSANWSRRFMKKVAKELKRSYEWQAREQYDSYVHKWNWYGIVKLFFWDRRRRDWDNYHKLSMDSLEWILYADDTQLQEMIVEKHYDKENPRIELYFRFDEDVNE